MEEKSSALNFISDYIMMMHSCFSSCPLECLLPTFLLHSLVPHLCSLELLLPQSHYLSLLWPPPPRSFSHLDSLFPPQSEYVFCALYGSYEDLQYVCACVLHMCLTLITLKNLVEEMLGFQSMKYGMNGFKWGFQDEIFLLTILTKTRDKISIILKVKATWCDGNNTRNALIRQQRLFCWNKDDKSDSQPDATNFFMSNI